MSKLIKFTEDDIMIEVDERTPVESTSQGMQPVSSRGVNEIAGRFENSMNTLKKVASAVINKVKDIPSSPDQVQVKLGLKFNVQAGVIIASTSTEGNLEVTLTWNKEKPEEKPESSSSNA